MDVRTESRRRPARLPELAIRAGTAFATSLALAATLAACSPSAAEPSPSPTEKPRFATDEEAYEAAVALYNEYSKVSTEIVNSGGAGSERLLDYADVDYANELLDEIDEMREQGAHMTGSGTQRAAGLESINDLRSELDVRMCLGIGDTRTIDADGNDVTKPDRDPEAPFLISFEVLPSQRVLMTGSDVWPGDDFC